MNTDLPVSFSGAEQRRACGDVIVACDFPTAEETFAFLRVLGDARPFLKIGMELF